jgi:hypothetical protein
MVVRNRKNWRTSSNARQKRDADAKLPHPRPDDTHSTLVQGLRIGWLITHHQPGIMRAVKGTGESQMDWPNGCSSKRHLMEELPVSGRWTHISDSRDLLVRQLDQDITRQPQAKVPLLLTLGVKQLLMHEAAVGKQDHMPLRQPKGAHLLKYRLIVLKPDRSTSVAHGPPSQRDGRPR